MLKIGSLTLENRVLQAPMAGVTDHACRVLCRAMGCAMTWSEMINDKGLLYGQARTEKMIGIVPEVRPMAVQLFGALPETLAEAAAIVEKLGADAIDLNMGCPAPKIVKNEEGSALMKDLPRCRAIIRAVRERIHVPLLVKMRKGFEDGEETCLALSKIAEEEGADAVTVHPRSRQQFFSGHSDWSMIRRVKEQLSIPVIGNGDIWKAQDAVDMLVQTGCDGVMIARGGMGNPFLFRETVALVERGEIIPEPTVEERMDLAEKHLALAIADKGEAIAVREMRKHISWYIRGLKGAARIREEVNQAVTEAEMLAVIARARQNQPVGADFSGGN